MGINATVTRKETDKKTVDRKEEYITCTDKREYKIKIKETREKQSMTEDTLADKLSVSRKKILDFENVDSNVFPNREQLRILKETLNIVFALTDEQKQLKKNIKIYREKRNLTQEQLGNLIGVSRSRMMNFENEEEHVFPNADELRLLCEEFKISFNELYGIEKLSILSTEHPFEFVAEYLKSSHTLGIKHLFRDREEAIEFFFKRYITDEIQWLKIITSSGRGILEQGKMHSNSVFYSRIQELIQKRIDKKKQFDDFIEIIQTNPCFAYQRELFEDTSTDPGMHIQRIYNKFKYLKIPISNLRFFPGIVSTMMLAVPSAMYLCHYISGSEGYESFAMIIEKNQNKDLYEEYFGKYWEECWVYSLSFSNLDKNFVLKHETERISDIVNDLYKKNGELEKLMKEYIIELKNLNG
jgi:transcriptional regulator with XRE-family HTH domain